MLRARAKWLAALVTVIAAVGGVLLFALPASGTAQHLSVSAPSQLTYGDGPGEVSATADSGLPVVLEVRSGPCTLTDGVLAAQAAGTCVLVATQAGDGEYRKASQTYRIEVSRGTQSIEFVEPGPRAYGEAPFEVEALATSGLLVEFTASGSCTVRGGEVTLTSPGSCTLTAAQSGDENFLPAESRSHRFRVFNITMEVTTKSEYYTVAGSTTEEIFDSLERNGPRLYGTPALGLISVQTRLGDKKLSQVAGGCEIESMIMSFTLTITLPQHVQPASLNATLRSRWEAFARAVTTHEENHAAIYSEGAAQIRQAIVAIPALPSCPALQAEIDRIWVEQVNILETNQEQFHVDDDARIEALRAPTKARLDAADARLATLDSQIRGLEAQVAASEREVASIEARLPGLQTQIRNLENAYPNGAPSNVVAQYNSLIDQYNGLVARHTSLISSGNAMIAQRNALADEYNRLLATRNQLVDEYNWLY